MNNLISALKESEFDPNLLILEVAEGLIMHDHNNTISILTKLKAEENQKAKDMLREKQLAEQQLAQAEARRAREAYEQGLKLQQIDKQRVIDLIALTTIYNQVHSKSMTKKVEAPVIKIPVPSNLLAIAKLLYELRKEGIALLLVGGVLRDLVKGKPPKDVDLVTEHTPEQLSAALHRIKLRTQNALDEDGKLTYSSTLLQKLTEIEEQQKTGRSFSWLISEKENSGTRWVVFHNPEIATLGLIADAVPRDNTQNALHGRIHKTDNQYWIYIEDSLGMSLRHIQNNTLQVVNEYRLHFDPIYLLRNISTTLASRTISSTGYGVA